MGLLLVTVLGPGAVPFLFIGYGNHILAYQLCCPGGGEHCSSKVVTEKRLWEAEISLCPSGLSSSRRS